MRQFNSPNDDLGFNRFFFPSWKIRSSSLKKDDGNWFQFLIIYHIVKNNLNFLSFIVLFHGLIYFIVNIITNERF